MSVMYIKLKSVYLNDLNEVNVVIPDPPMRSDTNPFQYYESKKKYKVLWILHGGRDTYRDWLIYSNVARLSIQHGMIIVMPNGHDSDFADHPEQGDGFLFEKYFFEELMPFIYNWLPASRKKEDNFLAGNSMGCAATWRYSISHSEKFDCFVPMCNQPVDYEYLEEFRGMTTEEFRKYVKENQGQIKGAYGDSGEKIHVKEINMMRKYDTMAQFLDSDENTMQAIKKKINSGDMPSYWIPYGTLKRDQQLVNFKEYCEKSNNTGKMHFEKYEGETHAFSFWERALQDFLKYMRIEQAEYYVGR